MDMTATRQASLTDRQVLEELNEGYIRSVEACDTAWFDQHLASDFMASNPDGTLADRAGFLRLVDEGTGLSEIEAHDVLIRITGDLAIIHGRTTFSAPGGRQGVGRYTDVWSRRAAGWECVAAHVARFMQ